MKNRYFIMLAAILLCACTTQPGTQWSREKAADWYAAQEWPVGCNYVPSYAINQLEFWQEETFDPATIDRELTLAEGLGFNTLRIYIHEMLWNADKDGLKSRMNRFLEIADSHGMKSVITFFTNGGNHKKEFQLGPQPDAIPGVHNSNWVPSPGREAISNPEKWPALKAYVQDILRTYKNDRRILYWCLCNEPENLSNGCDVSEFMPEVYKWAREVNPSQPVSSPVWIRPGYKGETTKLDMVAFVCQNSDIITFHCYYGPEEMATFIKMLKRFKRPMICQEYMGRTLGSTFQAVLPILKENRVGAINWGLVNGKCHFHLPWGHKDGDPEPEVWFHDIFRTDLTPYDNDEIEFIKSMTPEKSSSFEMVSERIVPNTFLLQKGNAIYPRIKKLKDGDYIMFFQDGRLGPNCYLSRSNDLKTWSEPEILFSSYETSDDTRAYATTDAVVLPDGDIIAVASYRAVKGYREGTGCGIVTRRSSDGGISWSEEESIYDGTNWEPYILSLPDGMLQCYFTDCNPAIKDSGTSVMVSADGGHNWSTPQKICRRYKYDFAGERIYTDQMPSFRLLPDGQTILGFLEGRLEKDGPGSKSTFTLSVVKNHGLKWSDVDSLTGEGPQDRYTDVCDGCAGYVSVFPDGRVLYSCNRSQRFCVRIANPDGSLPEKENWDDGWYHPLCGKGYWGCTEIIDEKTFVAAMHCAEGIQIATITIK